MRLSRPRCTLKTERRIPVLVDPPMHVCKVRDLQRRVDSLRHAFEKAASPMSKTTHARTGSFVRLSPVTSTASRILATLAQSEQYRDPNSLSLLSLRCFLCFQRHPGGCMPEVDARIPARLRALSAQGECTVWAIAFCRHRGYLHLRHQVESCFRLRQWFESHPTLSWTTAHQSKARASRGKSTAKRCPEDERIGKAGRGPTACSCWSVCIACAAAAVSTREQFRQVLMSA